MVKLKGNGALFINPVKVESLELNRNGTYKVTMQSGVTHIVSGEDADILAEKASYNPVGEVVDRAEEIFKLLVDKANQFMEDYDKNNPIPNIDPIDPPNPDDLKQ